MHDPADNLFVITTLHGTGLQDLRRLVPTFADADEEEEAESEQEEEDIFELEGQTEHLHIGTPREPAQAPERLRGRGGWEGAAGGEPCTCPRISCPIPPSQLLFGHHTASPRFHIGYLKRVQKVHSVIFIET